MAANANATAELMRHKSTPAPAPITPTIADAPIECSEPITPSNNVLPLRQEQPAPLLHATFSSATLIPDTEFAARYHDRVTKAWRQSISQNEAIARERHKRSLEYQAAIKGKYVG
jgi:hypothetical protein